MSTTMTSGWMVAIAMVAGLAACGGDDKQSDDATDTPAIDAAPTDGNLVDGPNAAVERGRYLMNNVAACTFCHTPLLPDGTRDLTMLLAGVDCFYDIAPDDPTTGCVSTRNLTNDATGLKNATDTQIKNAFRNGTRTDGKTLAPIMPYYVFHNISDADADAIVAYLRTVPGVVHTVQANQAPWSQINDSGTPVPFIQDSEVPMPVNAGADQESALRGRYLAGKTGLCIDCHTPANPPTEAAPLDLSNAFAGGRTFSKQDLGLFAPSYPDTITTRNLTPDATGLMGFTVAQIKAAIADGKDPMGNGVCAATHGSGISPYAALEAQDLTDIANYLHYLAPVAHDTGANCQGPPVP